MGFSGSILRKLQNISGKQNVTIEKEELLCYSYDATGRSYLPDVIVFPGSEEEIVQIVRLASQNQINIIPRGSGSGMTGGALPVEGGMVLVFNRMSRILEIDEENFVLRVEPGAIVGDIHQAVEEKNLFYPPDPASSAICTIGGNVGECAGGPRAVKYGVTRDYVLGLRAVLPSGDIIKTGVSTVKGVAGYDLTRLIVGSEGTLAIVTQITLKLLPKPVQVKTMAVVFNSMNLAAKAVSGIMKASVIPRCVEYLDREALNLVKDHLAFALTPEIKALLIIEVDGDQKSVDREAAEIETLCLSYNAVNIIKAEDPASTRKLWGARKALSPVMYKIANNKINEDVVVPISRIPDLIAVTQELSVKYGLKIVAFGHAGDGNIHCNILYNKTDKEEAARAHQAVDQLFEKTLALGGTITGEHGVGITKRKYLPDEVGQTQIELMKGIKKVFDPLQILNPGKIF